LIFCSCAVITSRRSKAGMSPSQEPANTPSSQAGVDAEKPASEDRLGRFAALFRTVRSKSPIPPNHPKKNNPAQGASSSCQVCLRCAGFLQRSYQVDPIAFQTKSGYIPESCVYRMREMENTKCNRCQRLVQYALSLLPPNLDEGLKPEQMVLTVNYFVPNKTVYIQWSLTNNIATVSILVEHLPSLAYRYKELLEIQRPSWILYPSAHVSPKGVHYLPLKKQIDPAMINDWVHECDQQHGRVCKPPKALDHLPRPTRMFLIDVNLACLVPATDDMKYVCLSYVWGSQKNPFQTTRENFAELSKPGAFKSHKGDLPTTVQDAFSLLKSLSLSYLWVDRFCIIQNSEEQKHAQIQSMASIYARSYFTVVATQGSNADSGLCGVLPDPERMKEQLIFDFDETTSLAVYQAELLDPTKPQSVWQTRGWTFQERMLSRRCLVFHNNTVKWECPTATHMECLRNYRKNGDSEPSSQERQEKYDIQYKPYPDLLQYTALVMAYSRRNLTFDTDGLNAFSAIISSMRPSFPSDFIYGHPECIFSLSLTWKPINLTGKREGFPSWSWISSKSELDLKSWVLDKPGKVNILSSWRWQNMTAPVGGWCDMEELYLRWRPYRDDFESPTPPGWRREASLFGGTARYYPNIVSKGKMPETSDGKFPSGGFNHPIPLPTGQSLNQSAPFSSLLRGTVQRAVIRTRDPPPGNQECRFRYLQSYEGQWIGTLYPDSLLEVPDGTDCELIALCWQEELFDDHQIARSNYGGGKTKNKNDDWYRYVNVLWVEQKENIAYRLGTGEVAADVWNTLATVGFNITLG
jgi:hypothetical protein